MHILTLSAKKHDQHLINNSEYLHKSTRENTASFFRRQLVFILRFLFLQAFKFPIRLNTIVWMNVLSHSVQLAMWENITQIGTIVYCCEHRCVSHNYPIIPCALVVCCFFVCIVFIMSKRHCSTVTCKMMFMFT